MPLARVHLGYAAGHAPLNCWENKQIGSGGKYFHYIHLVESVLQHIVKFKISPFLLHY